jgi:hypothetical protein
MCLKTNCISLILFVTYRCVILIMGYVVFRQHNTVCIEIHNVIFHCLSYMFQHVHYSDPLPDVPWKKGLMIRFCVETFSPKTVKYYVVYFYTKSVVLTQGPISHCHISLNVRNI